MNIHKTRPEEQVLIVKSPNAKGEFEFWVVKPVKVGTASTIGQARYSVAGTNKVYSTLDKAFLQLLERQGDSDFASRVKMPGTKANDGIVLTGRELLKKANWEKFCKVRNIDEDEFLASIKQTYQLSTAELALVGLAPPLTAEDDEPPHSHQPEELRSRG